MSSATGSRTVTAEELRDAFLAAGVRYTPGLYMSRTACCLIGVLALYEGVITNPDDYEHEFELFHLAARGYDAAWLGGLEMATLTDSNEAVSSLPAWMAGFRVGREFVARYATELGETRGDGS